MAILQHHILSFELNVDQALHSLAVSTRLHLQANEGSHLCRDGSLLHLRSHRHRLRYIYLYSLRRVLGFCQKTVREVCQSRCVSCSTHTILTSHDASLITTSMYHANAGLNISTDLLVAVLPVRAIWKLQIAMRQKLALLFILTIGWLYVSLFHSLSAKLAHCPSAHTPIA